MTSLPVVAAALLLQSATGDSSVVRHASSLLPPTATAVRVDRAPAVEGRLDESLRALS